MATSTPSTNGTGQSRIAQQLQADMAAAYRPTLPIDAM